MPKHQQNCKIERSNRAEYQLAPSEKLNQKRTQKESSRNLYVSQVFDTPKGNHQTNCFFLQMTDSQGYSGYALQNYESQDVW